MGIFTITPTVGLTYNSYFIPNASGCATQLTPAGAVNNWDCVNDPIAIPDADTTYVYSSATNLKYDLYNIPNHTTESGTINYVQVYSRAKAHETAQHEDGIYKILITDDDCANIYKSADINLITSYNTYNNVWTENPRTGVAFTWDDVDNLQFGVECSSPTVLGVSSQIVLRPNAAGDSNTLERNDAWNGDATNYTYVDEAVPDHLTSFISWDNSLYPNQNDLYNIDNVDADIVTANPIITNVTLFALIRHTGASQHYFKFQIKTGGNLFRDAVATPTTQAWVTYSEEYLINPDTVAAWTWAEINALQIGYNLIAGTISAYIACTQTYLIVDYTEQLNPQIRTTQEYAKVNYTVDPTPCTFPKPEEISIDHAQNVKMLNFWSGRRAVYGLSRNNRTMVMTGKLYADDACTTIECVIGIAESGTTISLSGLGYNDYDREVKIISFGWKKMSDKPSI